MIRAVRIEVALDRTRGHPQRPTTSGGLDGLEVEPLDRTRAYERFDLGRELPLEGRCEPPLLAASAEAARGPGRWVSHSLSLTSTSSPVSLRKRRYSAICSRVWVTALGGIILVTVLPPTRRVSDQLGPWPAASAAAQWQPGLPHRR